MNRKNSRIPSLTGIVLVLALATTVATAGHAPGTRFADSVSGITGADPEDVFEGVMYAGDIVTLTWGPEAAGLSSASGAISHPRNLCLYLYDRETGALLASARDSRDGIGRVALPETHSGRPVWIKIWGWYRSSSPQRYTLEAPDGFHRIK